MQKIIFFTPVVETGKLSTIISEKSVSELKDEGIIPTNSPTLVKNFDEADIDFLYNVYHIDFFKFNNNTNPTDIVLNKELFEIHVIEAFRHKRNTLFQVLDTLQNRALVSNKPDIVAEIEKDKQILRDLPDNLDLSNNTKVQDFYYNWPVEIFVDYKAKYEPKLK